METDTQKVPIKFGRYGCVLWVIGIAIAISLLFRFIHWMYPPPDAPLFASASGLQLFSTVADAQAKINQTLALPTQRFGAELYAIGYYPLATTSFPAQTIHAIFAKDGHRTFEVLILPLASEAVIAHLAPGARGSDITIGSVTGFIADEGRLYPVCVEVTPHRALPVCQITKRLVFTRNGVTYLITDDGTHLTTGELIEIARSIP